MFRLLSKFGKNVISSSQVDNVGQVIGYGSMGLTGYMIYNLFTGNQEKSNIETEDVLFKHRTRRHPPEEENLESPSEEVVKVTEYDRYKPRKVPPGKFACIREFYKRVMGEDAFKNEPPLFDMPDPEEIAPTEIIDDNEDDDEEEVEEEVEETVVAEEVQGTRKEEDKSLPNTPDKRTRRQNAIDRKYQSFSCQSRCRHYSVKCSACSGFQNLISRDVDTTAYNAVHLRFSEFNQSRCRHYSESIRDLRLWRILRRLQETGTRSVNYNDYGSEFRFLMRSIEKQYDATDK
ncbi:hypothetical protein ANN_04875 [Periplaneta americana]|uniref:Uncharacterized protein n=1 Tax=Periplaneta americana TaxID=6978 RepID=A0ABQ8TB98_PERAM|nr:hypothetical protein ANN_04875 [Periplaneta americana]